MTDYTLFLELAKRAEQPTQQYDIPETPYGR